MRLQFLPKGQLLTIKFSRVSVTNPRTFRLEALQIPETSLGYY
jgi:hypothetical protein